MSFSVIPAHAGIQKTFLYKCWITEYIPVLRPSGQPAAVQIRSLRICPDLRFAQPAPAQAGVRNDG